MLSSGPKWRGPQSTGAAARDYFVRCMEENGNKNITVINRFTESAEVNAELRKFAEKLRGSKERVRDDSACVSVTEETLVTPSHGHDGAAIDAKKSHRRRRHADDDGLEALGGSSKSRYPGAGAKSSVFSAEAPKRDAGHQQLAKPRLTSYLKDWLRLKEKRNVEYLNKYLRTHPVVSEYKREHIRRFGKPTFMNNAQAYLRRKEFVVNHSRLD